ncbi:recombinase family protein [Vagococcus sp. BWB3-3]|uniref:Recombinase family protein n=1 Tax=Vagococcus allomyrinae TaxID=2794353 RepID=A0A940P848_9ENTE|nr:recombinase family protein [Vagococcus allomyrinae]MBP1042815.1 recombinase family protein [Vagococcus allomyrinae]
MRLGYVQLMTKHQNGEKESHDLTKTGCKVYIEREKGRKMDWKKRPKLRQLFEESEPGDVLVLTELSQFSDHYQIWLEFLTELKHCHLELEVLSSPHNTLADWQDLFKWIQSSAEGQQAGVKIKKFSKERASERSDYRFFSRNPYFRRVYREILQQVMAGRSLRQITKESDVPLGTIVRIRKEYAKLKQTCLLVGTFLLTIISLKMVQNYSSNLLLQILICGVMTLLIIYFSYSDSQLD